MTDHSNFPKDKISFIHARLFNPHETQAAIEERLKWYLHKLRRQSNRISNQKIGPLEPYYNANYQENSSKSERFASLNQEDHDKIKRRTKSIITRRKAISSLDHLKREDRERLESELWAGVKLITIHSEHQADLIAAKLHAEMPWMSQVSDIVWKAMRRSVVAGLPSLQIPPLLLVGSPGIGKSHFARRLAHWLALPTTILEATGENAGFGIVGSQRGWSSAHPGRALQTILQSKVANPVVVVDEIDKCGTAISSAGISFGLTDALLPLLEPLTAQTWSCPYYQVSFDMSHIIWILTANDTRRVPEPLMSRCPPIRLRHLTAAELIEFVLQEGMRRGISQLGIETMSETISRQTARHSDVSLRDALRLLQITAHIESRPTPH